MRWLWLFLLYGLPALAQVRDDFDDGDFTVNPAWAGTPGAWLVNADGMLQSSFTTPNSSFYLCTPSALAMQGEWEWSLRLNFNPSSSNYADLYLISEMEALTATGNKGYFVRVGGATDDIALYRRDGASTVLLVDGIDGTTDKSTNSLRIKVIRNSNGRFALLRHTAGGDWFIEGAVTDILYTTSAYTGILVRQSTASFFGKHFMDSITAKPWIPDTQPPQLQDAAFSNSTTAELLFDEPLAPGSALPAHFTIQGTGAPQQVTIHETDGRRVRLQFAQAFAPGSYNLQVTGIEDGWGNASTNTSRNIIFYRAIKNDIVIHEIMADPSPPVGLPEGEFIELRNRSSHSINLQDWELFVGTQAVRLPFYRVPADSLVILCLPSQAGAFGVFGAVLPVPGLPVLANEGGLLWLTNEAGETIHAVSYAAAMYDEVKGRGGWSLEMIDGTYPCAGASNWMPSVHASGGTPGRPNSVSASQRDDTSPRLTRTYALDSLQVMVLFDKPLDSNTAAQVPHYNFEPAISISSAQPQPPLFKEVKLQLAAPLPRGAIFDLTVTGIRDCSGNTIGVYNKTHAGLPIAAQQGDLVINEILFNPRPGGVDYIEIYHAGKAPIDAGALFIGSKSISGSRTIAALDDRPFVLFPGDHAIISEDIKAVTRQYYVPPEAKVFLLSSLPSFPDDEGHCILLNEQGQELDGLQYEDNWHFPLITDADGIALERIDPLQPTQKKDNWHSAASTSGYGTPGARNSQILQTGAGHATVEVQPKIISPDNDGFEDVLNISYKMNRSGAVANIHVFDIYGNRVRHLVKNGLLGEKGQWTWDGTGENARRLAAGMYIIFTEIFDLDGDRSKYRHVVVLAGRR